MQLPIALRAVFLTFASVCSIALSQNVFGQAEINLPPIADAQSPTGVSFKTGGFNIPGVTDLSIGGPGISGLQLVRNYSSTYDLFLYNYNAQGWSPNSRAYITRNIHQYSPDESPPPDHLIPMDCSVLTGHSTSRFRCGTKTSWAVNVPGGYGYEKNGEKLTFTKVGTGDPNTGSYFTFTDRTGAVYTYNYTGFPANLTNVVFPDGTRFDYYSGYRLIISNRGYALLWESASKACAINMAEFYVSSATTTCPAGAMSVTYTYGPTGGAGSSTNLTGVTNALGQTTTYSYFSYTGGAHLSCIKDPGQSTCKISNTYMVCPPPPPPPTGAPAKRILDQVISQVTGTGESYSYTYSGYTADICNDYTGYGVTGVMHGPGGAVTAGSTNGAGALWEIVDPLNHTTSFGYDDTLNPDPYQATQPSGTWYNDGNTIGAVRDPRGNITTKTMYPKSGSGLGNIAMTASYPTTCTNPKTCNKPDYIVDARSNRTDYTWDPTHGGILTETRPADPNGIRPQKRYFYTQLYAWIKNSSGAFVQASSPIWMLTSTSECMTLTTCAGTADERKTTFTYGSTGVANNLLPTSVTVASGSGSVSSTTTTTYDSAGNSVLMDGPVSGSSDTIRTRFDALRRVVGVVSPDPDDTGPLPNRATRNTYDASGELIKAEAGTVASQSDTDWLSFVSLESTETTFDVMGRKLKETKWGGGTVFGVTQYNYDNTGRPNCVAVRMDPAQWNTQTDACVPQTTGPFGPDRIAKNIYDIAGERTILKMAYGTTDASDESTATFTGNGKIATVTDGEGNKTTYTYDGHDRLWKTAFPSKTTPGSSSASDIETLTYDGNGNITQRVLRDSQSIVYTYDNLDRITAKDLPGAESDVAYSLYDLLGHVKTATKGMTNYYSWDALGRLTNETGACSGASMAYNYDAAGRRIWTQWPDGFYVTQDFYNTGEVWHIREYGASSGPGVLATYGLDSRGNRTALTRGNGTTTTRVSDSISRIQSINNDLNGTAFDVNSSFSYNPAGQIASTTISNDSFAWNGHYNVNRTYGINGLNELTTAGSAAIVYDNRGNLTSDGTTTYGYSSENALTSVSGGGNLFYDASGRLFKLEGASSTWLQYDGTDLVLECDASNTVQRRYVHGPGADEPLVWYEGTGTSDKRYLHQDERGSVIAVSDGLGAKLGINSFDEYGVATGAVFGRYSYTGQMWIGWGPGLYYYKARVYAPTLGRFLQSDPTGYDDGLNLYAYVEDDPLNRTDPTGEEGAEITQDNDVRQLLHGEITQEEYSDRATARGVGAIAGAGTVLAVWGGAEVGAVVMARLSAPALRRATQVALRKMTNTIRENLKPSDFEGVRKEIQGIKTGWDHVTEMRNSLKSLKDVVKSLKGSLNNPNLKAAAKREIKEAVARAQEYMAKMEAALRGE